MANEIKLPLGNSNASISDDDTSGGNDGKPFIEDVDLGIEDPKPPAELTAEQEAAQQAADAEAARIKAEEEATGEGGEGGEGEGTSNVPTEVEIEGKSYTLDAAGNALDADGKTMFTAEDLSAMEELSDDEEHQFELAELSNIQPVDQEGNAIQYEPTPEGRRQYIEDVYNAGGIDRAEKIIEQRYAANPLLKTVSDYIIANGSLDGFSEEPFSRNPITKDSTDDEMVAAIRQARTMKGDSELEIANIISWAKSDNKLNELAATSDEYLNRYESEQRTALAERAAQVEQDRLARSREYVDTIINTVQNGVIELGGKQLVIPAILEINTPQGPRVAQREELIDYATRVNQYRMPDGSVQNATQYQIDKWVKSNNRNINDDVFDMINLFTGGDNSQLINQAVNHNTSQTIKRRFKLKRNNADGSIGSNTNGKIKLKYSK